MVQTIRQPQSPRHQMGHLRRLKNDLLREDNLARPKGNRANTSLHTFKQTGLVLQLRTQFRNLLADADERLQSPFSLVTVFHQALTPKLFNLAHLKPTDHFQKWEDLADWGHEKSLEIAPDDWHKNYHARSNGKPHRRQNQGTSRRRRFRKTK